MNIEEKIKIEKAIESFSSLLKKIAFEAKRHWKYPEEYYKVWEDELTISDEYISRNIVYYAVLRDEVVGFYSIVNNKEGFFSGNVFVQKGFWLEHIFILPEFHNQGIGRVLIEHAINYCKLKEIRQLLVFSDPNAVGFYNKLNAVFLYNSSSSIINRYIPVFEFRI